jgi:cell wall-associated NlpC family hydrolase
MGFLSGGNMWAEKYIGLPYKSLGRSLRGVDCYGLVYLVYKHELNIDLPKIDIGYQNGLNSEEVAPVFEKGINSFLSDYTFKKVNDFKSFDLLLYRRSGYISHIAICLNDKQFLHADLGSRSCIENINHKYWVHRLVGVYRYAN